MHGNFKVIEYLTTYKNIRSTTENCKPELKTIKIYLSHKLNMFTIKIYSK